MHPVRRLGGVPPALQRSAFVAFAAVCAGCAGRAGDGATPSLPESYLGVWYYTGSSGGIAGDGLGDAAVGWIEITADNTISHFDDDGRVLRVESFELTRGPSIFSSDDVWIIHAEAELERVIGVDAEGRLGISDNVYDGFHFAYARSRPAGEGS